MDQAPCILLPADDQPILLDGLEKMLEHTPWITLGGTPGTAPTHQAGRYKMPAGPVRPQDRTGKHEAACPRSICSMAEVHPAARHGHHPPWLHHVGRRPTPSFFHPCGHNNFRGHYFARHKFMAAPVRFHTCDVPASANPAACAKAMVPLGALVPFR